jgi:hypothetical protein
MMLPCIRRLVVLGLISALSGCAALKAVTFQKSDLTGVAPGTLAVGLSPALVGSGAFTPALERDPQLEKLLVEDCGVKRPPPPTRDPALAAAPMVIPIIAAFVQIGVDVLFAKLEDDAEALRASATAEYGTRMILEDANWRSLKCLVIVRYSSTDAKQPELVAVSKFVWYPSDTSKTATAFTLQPIYLRANRFVAVAAKSDPTMDVIIAVGVKAIHTPARGVPAVVTGGASTNTVYDLKPGMPAACAPAECDPSDLVALPQGLSVISFGVSVTELGRVGFNIDLVKKQLEAMRSALGPALAEAATIRLTPPPPPADLEPAEPQAPARVR